MEECVYRTCFPTRPLTLLFGLEAVQVTSAASVPEAGTALAEGIEVPLQHKLHTGALLFRQLTDVH